MAFHLAAASAAHPVAQDAQQVAGARRFAGLDADDLVLARQLLQLPRLRDVAVHQLQVLGLVEGVVAVGGLVTVGHHVAGERRQHLLTHRVGGDRRHAGKRPQGTRDGHHLAPVAFRGLGFGRRQRQLRASRGAILLEVPLCGRAVPRQQVESHQPPRHRPAARLVARLREQLQNFVVGFAARRIGVAIEELCVFRERRHIFRGRLRRPRQQSARPRCVARPLHLTGTFQGRAGLETRNQRKCCSQNCRECLHGGSLVWVSQIARLPIPAGAYPRSPAPPITRPAPRLAVFRKARLPIPAGTSTRLPAPPTAACSAVSGENTVP